MWIIIPVLALSIPIVAIIAGGPIGKAIGENLKNKNPVNPDSAKKIKYLESRIESLEEQVSDLSSGIKQIEEKNEFFRKLMDDDK